MQFPEWLCTKEPGAVGILVKTYIKCMFNNVLLNEKVLFKSFLAYIPFKLALTAMAITIIISVRQTNVSLDFNAYNIVK